MKSLVTKLTMVTVLTALMSSCGILRDDFHRAQHGHRKWKRTDYVKQEAEPGNTRLSEVAHHDRLRPDELENSGLTANAEEHAQLESATESAIQPPAFLQSDTKNESFSHNEDLIQSNTSLGSSIEFNVPMGKRQLASLQVRPERLKPESPAAPNSDAMLIILVILAIILPPLAVFIYEQASTRFWLDLLFWAVGWGVGLALFGLGVAGLMSLLAVIYALLIVLEVI